MIGQKCILYRCDTGLSHVKATEDAPEIVICCLEKPSPLARFQQTVNTVQQCLRDPNAPTSSQDLADKRWMLGRAKHPLAHAMGLDEHMTIRGHGHLLSIFSLEDFLQRLSEIRDLYQARSRCHMTCIH